MTLPIMVVAALVVLGVAPAARGADKIVFGHAAPAALTWAQVSVARELGYLAAEGLDVEEAAFPGGSNSVAQTVNKKADVSYPGNEPVIIGKQKGKDPLPVKFYYNATPTVIWEMIVLQQSPIQGYRDLKGKNIGIFAPSASNVPQIKAIVRREGLNPDTDIQMRSIGLGAGALNALKSGTVDVIALYAAEHATYETMGASLRRLPTSPAVERLFSNGLLTHEDNLKDPKRRQMLVGIARAFAKTTIFCDTNPRACVQLAWKRIPALKPTGVDEKKAMDDALHVLEAINKNLRLRDYQGGQYGKYDPGAWQAYVDFMLAEKVLEQPVDVNTLFTNELIEEINRFDRQEVVRRAKGM
jgi:NitT/TauT family transport system substrate-binding protein